MFEGAVPYFVVVDLPTNQLVRGGHGVPATIPAFLGQSDGGGLDLLLMHDDLGQGRERLNGMKASLLLPVLAQIQTVLGGPATAATSWLSCRSDAPALDRGRRALGSGPGRRRPTGPRTQGWWPGHRAHPALTGWWAGPPPQSRGRRPQT